MDTTNIIQIISLGVSGWVLIEIITLKVSIARTVQRLDDLPCQTLKKCKE